METIFFLYLRYSLRYNFCLHPKCQKERRLVLKNQLKTVYEYESVYDECGDENSAQDEFIEENEKISENSLT